MFFDRERELKFLESHFDTGKPELLILYGRRRVGKTRLMKEFHSKNGGVYHLVSRETEKGQIEEFKESLAEKKPGYKDLKNDWETLLKNAGKEFKSIIIDEFQYLIETDKNILKTLNKVWENNLEDENVMIVLTGSSIGMMKNEVLGYKSPIYGRRTGQWHLKPLKPDRIHFFFPEYSPEELIQTYAVAGGTPYYLERFESEKSVFENIGSKILKPGSVLNEEARFLLQQELRTPDSYFSVLKAVARGENRFNQISDSTGIKTKSLSKYLRTLRDLKLLEKELPVTASEKSNRGRYRISDSYFRFWFRYVFPNSSQLEINWENVLENRVKPDFNRFVSKEFEKVCRHVIRRKGINSKVGRWWYQEDEIDIIALDEGSDTILFGECKWRNSKTGLKTLKSLENKSESVRWHGEEINEDYAVFSRKGFTEELEKKAEERDDLELYTPNELNLL